VREAAQKTPRASPRVAPNKYEGRKDFLKNTPRRRITPGPLKLEKTRREERRTGNSINLRRNQLEGIRKKEKGEGVNLERRYERRRIEDGRCRMDIGDATAARGGGAKAKKGGKSERRRAARCPLSDVGGEAGKTVRRIERTVVDPEGRLSYGINDRGKREMTRSRRRGESGWRDGPGRKEDGKNQGVFSKWCKEPAFYATAEKRFLEGSPSDGQGRPSLRYGGARWATKRRM